jgi:hypothetical protein
MQSQMATFQRKLHQSAAAIKAKEAELVDVKQALFAVRVDAQQLAFDGPNVQKLKADFVALKEELREAKVMVSTTAVARDKAERQVGHLERQSGEVSAQLERARVRHSYSLDDQVHFTSLAASGMHDTCSVRQIQPAHRL